MSDEDAIKKLLVETRILERTAESMRSRLNFVNAALTELNIAHETLKNLEKQEVKSSLLIPIGGGSYVKSNLEDKENILYGIGAGIIIEESISKSKEGVFNRISELNKTNHSLQKQLSEVLSRIESSRSQLQNFAKKVER